MRLDLTIEEARIWTGQPARPFASRVGVWNGRIVGVDEELQGCHADRVLNAEGAVIVPGFNDVHAHSVWFGQTLLELNLSAVASGRELLDTIRRHTEKHSSDAREAWVIASNFNPLALRGDIPGRDALDAATGGRPLWIKHASGHAYTLNGVALRAVGISDSHPEQVPGGTIVVDETGRPTGLIEENAMEVVQRLLMPDAVSDIVRALDAATKQYLHEGITSVTDAGIAGGWIGRSPREFGAYQQALESQQLHTRMQTMITLDALHPIPGHREEAVAMGLDTGLRTGVGDEWLQVGPVKVFTDGSLLGSTAAMQEEYAHCPGNHGYLLGDPQELRQQVLQAASQGWSLALHAIGDHAMEYALDTIHQTHSTYGRPRIPHRIEHGGVVHQDQVRRLATERIVLAPQPGFIPAFGDGMAANLGPERTQLSYPAKRLLEAGAVLPGSSDRPVAPGAPLHVIESFVTRRTESGALYAPADRITAAEALSAYTRGSAVATGWGDHKGTIERGKLADFAVLEALPMDVATDRIGAIGVLATIIGGELKYGHLPDR